MFIDNVAYIEKHSADDTEKSRSLSPPRRRHGYVRPYDDIDYESGDDLRYERDSPKVSSYKDIPILGEIADLGMGLSACSCDDCRGKRVHPPPGFQWADYDLINPLTTASLDLPEGPNGTKHRYLLCSRRLFGFVFKSRKWGQSLFCQYLATVRSWN